MRFGNSTDFEDNISQILKDKGGKKFLLLLVKKGIIIGLYPKEGGCHGYILRPQDHAGAAPFHF